MNKGFKVDFLCVGFQKCATTTLDAILRQHSHVSLPVIKELHLEEWAYKCRRPMKVIEEKFFQNYSNKKIGIIDPNLRDCSRIIYKHMGKDIKLIFIMRNPVDRLLSYYKMALKFGYHNVYPSTLYGREVTNVSRAFGRYVKEELRKEHKEAPILWGNYIDVILDFEKYYSRDKMKFIFFEDFIIDPEMSCREIFDFLALPYEALEFNVREYSGNCISRNNLCFKINSTIISEKEKMRCNPNASVSRFNKVENFFEEVSRYTTIVNSETMSTYTRKQLERYYQDSKQRLEEYLDVDLTHKWF